MAGDPAFLRRTGTGVTIEVRAQPRARRTALACSGGVLKAQVTAPAEDGRANAAVIELLAATWRVPKSAFSVTRGATSRDKVISIAGEPALLAAKTDWARESAGRDG
ncbi:MAG: DUF167 domain-containing protein [Rhodospirillales bacterium]|nr:DUF167 domain-containing protein [Rhodospirillales bacterium]